MRINTEAALRDLDRRVRMLELAVGARQKAQRQKLPGEAATWSAERFKELPET